MREHRAIVMGEAVTGMPGGSGAAGVRRRWLWVLLGVMGVALIVVGVIAVTYAGARGQLPSLPGMSAQGKMDPPHFQSALYGVTRPLGVAVSPVDGRVYVTESDGDREVKVFERNGTRIGALVPPDTDSHSRLPVYAAVNSQGQVYVSDRTRQIIDIYGPDGSYMGHFLPKADAEFNWAPLAVGFDGEDRLIATDVAPGHHRVLIFAPDGQLLAEYAPEGDNALSFPNAVAASRQGLIYVSDSNNGRVVVLSYKGESLAQFDRGAGGARIGLPRGLGIDSLDRLYVVDATNHSVQAYNIASERLSLLFSFGVQGIKDGQFNFPNGLAVQGKDRLYVTDRENNRVQIWGF